MIVEIIKKFTLFVTFFYLEFLHVQDIHATEIKSRGICAKTTFEFRNLPVTTFTHTVCNPQLDLIKIGFNHTHTDTHLHVYTCIHICIQSELCILVIQQEDHSTFPNLRLSLEALVAKF